MKDYGTIFRTKKLRLLDAEVGIITARYSFIDGGVKGYIILTQLSEMTKIVLFECVLLDGTVKQVKDTINQFFDNMSI